MCSVTIFRLQNLNLLFNTGRYSKIPIVHVVFINWVWHKSSFSMDLIRTEGIEYKKNTFRRRRTHTCI